MNNLRIIRRTNGLNELGQKTGIPQNVISLIERNFKDPSMKAKKIISVILNCRVEDIFPEMK